MRTEVTAEDDAAVLHSDESVTHVAIILCAPPILAGWLRQLIAKNGAMKDEVVH